IGASVFKGERHVPGAVSVRVRLHDRDDLRRGPRPSSRKVLDYEAVVGLERAEIHARDGRTDHLRKDCSVPLCINRSLAWHERRAGPEASMASSTSDATRRCRTTGGLAVRRESPLAYAAASGPAMRRFRPDPRAARYAAGTRPAAAWR